MRSSVASYVSLVALVTGLASVHACSSGAGDSNNPFAMPTTGTSTSSTSNSGGAGPSGNGGSAMAGSQGAGTAGAGGQLAVDASGAGGSGAMAGSREGGTAGAAGQLTIDASSTGGTGGAAGAPEGGTAGAAGQSIEDGGHDGGIDITKIVPTAGCGKNPGQEIAIAVRGTIQTMGTKPGGCADSKCGDWSYEREYFVTLPQGYNNTKAYPLVFQGPGCGSTGTAVYPLNDNVDNTVIRVGLTPPPNAIGHATNPNQGCFDDKEGDDSVDWVLYENLHDKLGGQLCFDKNRVFFAGNSSGAWLSNEAGCKYAGDPVHPVRGIMGNTGGLPNQPQYLPTCTDQPMAGMWIYEAGDTTGPFPSHLYAISRAMKVNGCTIGNSLSNAELEDFPIGGGNPDNACRKMKGCSDLAPLVICALPGNAHGSHDTVANPGFATFIKMFSAPPFLTP